MTCRLFGNVNITRSVPYFIRNNFIRIILSEIDNQYRLCLTIWFIMALRRCINSSCSRTSCVDWNTILISFRGIALICIFFSRLSLTFNVWNIAQGNTHWRIHFAYYVQLKRSPEQVTKETRDVREFVFTRVVPPRAGDTRCGGDQMAQINITNLKRR